MSLLYMRDKTPKILSKLLFLTANKSFNAELGKKLKEFVNKTKKKWEKYDPESERNCFGHVTYLFGRICEVTWGRVSFSIYWRGRFTHGIKIMDNLCNYYKLLKAPEWSSSHVNRAKSLQYLVFKPGLSERCSNGKWTDNKHIISECLQLLLFLFQHTEEDF